MASALHLDRPFFGSRRMAVTLGVGRTRIRRLMRILGIEAHYPKHATYCSERNDPSVRAWASARKVEFPTGRATSMKVRFSGRRTTAVGRTATIRQASQTTSFFAKRRPLWNSLSLLVLAKSHGTKGNWSDKRPQ